MTIRKLSTRISVTILAALLLVSAASCGKDPTSSPETNPPAALESQTPAETSPDTSGDTTLDTLDETHPEAIDTTEAVGETDDLDETEVPDETGTGDETESIVESETLAETLAETVAETVPDAETTPADHRPAEEVKVVSFNLDANESTSNERSQRLLPLILSYEPDSIGVQEARGNWVRLLNQGLVAKGYTRVGVDAGGNANATFGYFATYIFYRSDKYDLIESGTFWMSKTPDVPSIYDSTVDCNRTCTWALLENKETGFRYIHMNCHLDWMNMEVNKIQVAMIREQIERFEAMGYPVFATGDYNCDEGTASYKEMLKSDVIADSKHVADKTMDLGTYPSYGQYDVTVTKPIDYVFVTKNMADVHEYKVIDEKPGGEYVSDHNGLFVHATVKALPTTEDAKTIPQFEKDSVTVSADGAISAEVCIRQAISSVGTLASSYRIELVGTDAKPATVSSGVLTLDPAEVVIHTVSGLTDGKSYTLRVTPISVFGDEGTPVEIPFTFTSPVPPVQAEEMSPADIFELSVLDGKPVDISPNAMPITVVSASGIPVIEGTDHTFSNKGNYKVPGIKQHYANLQDGFTIELHMTTGDDISTYQNPVSNMHAGGFGMEIDSMSAGFSVRLGDSYIKVHAPVTENTTYHFVAVYDQAAGELCLYANGELQDSIKVNQSMNLPTHAGAEYLCIGADSDATGAGEYPFDGTIHALRIYGDAATAGNALWLWNRLNMPTAIFDLAVQEGKPVDISPNAMPIEVVGSTSIDGNRHIFDMNGNYKVPGIKNHYADLQDGFTFELYITTSNVGPYQTPAANFHAGGFGVEIEAMSLSFAIRLGDAYTRVYAPIADNTTYHVVAVCDPDAQEMRLYLNGELTDTLEIVGTMGLPTDKGAEYLCIGADSDASGKGEDPFAGTIHHVRIYSEPVSDSTAFWLWEQIGR